jgi:hypothetical protein
MPLIATLRRTLRKILFMAFILTILLYEPAFRATLSILVNLHIFARMGFDLTQHTVRTHFPTIATWTSAAWLSLHAIIISTIQYAKRVTAPLVPQVVTFVASWILVWLRESPRMLCTLNSWLLSLAEYLLTAPKAEDILSMSDSWKAVEEGTTKLCGLT